MSGDGQRRYAQSALDIAVPWQDRARFDPPGRFLGIKTHARLTSKLARSLEGRLVRPCFGDDHIGNEGAVPMESWSEIPVLRKGLLRRLDLLGEFLHPPVIESICSRCMLQRNA